MQGWERQKPKTINEKMGMGPVLFGTCPHFYFELSYTVENGLWSFLRNDRQTENRPLFLCFTSTI